ncbi:MAG TPA: biotin transporter BioY [Candidatus Eisenbacteria bacterium]|jgi:biotin transport system substrate-specific component
MSGSARTLTLADIALPRTGLLHDALLATAASLLTAMAARIVVPLPWTPVPLTGQTFAVLLSGAVLGVRRGFLAQSIYLTEGTLGLPVFAGGAAGWATFAGPTGGYLAAFPFAAALTGMLAERGWDRRFPSMLGAMLAGSSVIFAGGLLGLSRFVPAPGLLAAGLLPFIPGDLVKAALAALVFPTLWRRVDRRGRIDA